MIREEFEELLVRECNPTNTIVPCLARVVRMFSVGTDYERDLYSFAVNNVFYVAERNGMGEDVRTEFWKKVNIMDEYSDISESIINVLEDIACRVDYHSFLTCMDVFPPKSIN